ncbi:MAG: glycoside hydrolase family 28 protein [Verrucomicrobia bacterium]|nr:glycoside hydrolase family 28 protein [Verrucomicrobiota bacterium]
MPLPPPAPPPFAPRLSRRRFLGVVGGGAAGFLATSSVAAPPAAPWPDLASLPERLPPPRIPSRQLRLDALGASANGTADALPALRKGLQELARAGGGRLIVPPGTWRLDGPIHLTSGINLHLDEGAVLRFTPNPPLYLPPVLTRFEGTELFNHSPCLYAYQAHHIAITGRGIIDGNGAKVCTEWRQQQRPDRDRLRAMGAEGVPVAQRVFGAGHFLRYGLIQFFGCSQVLLEDFTALNSPFWCIHTVACSQVRARRLRVEGDHLNNDCFDPESSSEVLIEDCFFRSGDDCIAIKSGRDQDGWRLGRPSEDILIRNCELHSTGAAAIAIGSEMSGGVRRVRVENCRIGRARQGFNCKGNLDRGGVVEQVRVRGLTAESVDEFIQLTLDYQGLRVGGHAPRFRDFEFRGLHCREAVTGFSALGVAGAEFADLRLEDVTVDRARQPTVIRHARSLRFDRVRINGTEMRPPPAG